MGHQHVVNEQDLDWVSWEAGPTFGGQRKQLGTAASGKQLGCSLIRVEPGKRAWPAHAHFANEEAIYILKGRGTIRLGDHHEEVGPGAYIAMPADPTLAHQLVNTGTEPLEYLCLSTMTHPEVVVYPDSNKVGVLAGSAPGDPKGRVLTHFFPAETAVDYWTGERKDV